MRDGVDVERGNVAALDVLGVILGVVRADAAAVPAVPGNALSEVQEDRTGRIAGLDGLIIGDGALRRDGSFVEI